VHRYTIEEIKTINNGSVSKKNLALKQAFMPDKPAFSGNIYQRKNY
jgi:hypothetical protein